jgi:hypothetical protein
MPLWASSYIRAREGAGASDEALAKMAEFISKARD